MVISFLWFGGRENDEGTTLRGRKVPWFYSATEAGKAAVADSFSIVTTIPSWWSTCYANFNEDAIKGSMVLCILPAKRNSIHPF